MKNILKYGLLLLSLLGSAAITACSSGDGDGAGNAIHFDGNPVMAAAGGGAYSVTVFSTHDWTATPAAEWITDCTVSGADGGVLSLTVAPNEGDDFRDGAVLLTIPGSSYSTQLTVRQISYGEGLQITPSGAHFPTGGGTVEVVVYATGGWELGEVTGDWIAASRKNNSAITVTVAPNFTGGELAGEIMLRDTDGAGEYRVPVTQEFDGALFPGATTPLGRRLVYGSDGLVDRVISDEQYALDGSVEVLEIAYLSSVTGVQEPYRAFVFEVTLGGGTTILATTADDDDASIQPTNTALTKVQTVSGQLSAMQDNRPGLTVLGGVNGDFFYGSDNNLLHGVIYRGGDCLKGTFDGGSACTLFAVMDDGTARIMTQAQYAAADKSKIAEAVGGRQILLSNGVTVSQDETMEPRTAVGVSEDGTRVTLLVVDGRRPEYSVGASYAIMSRIFRAMGTWDAINLDGGGSSTFCVRENPDGSPGSFTTRNRPTDTGGEREVVNGLAIVKPN